VALVGPNGAGKTTLLRIVANELAADAGAIELGHQVVPGYYAQHCADNLHGSLNIMQTLWETIPEQSVTYVRTVLGTFLFSGDDALKPVSVLSGGERARVALARLVVNPTNFLLLDEPTSHLDLNASEALAEALEQYGGAVLFVSHNLSLLKRLATKVWEVRDGQVREYVAGFDYYLEQREREQLEANRRAEQKDDRRTGTDDGKGALADEKRAAAAAPRSRDDVKAKKRAEAEFRQVLAKKLGGIPKKIAELEARISELEAQQQQLEQTLARSETYQDQARYQDLLRDYTAAKTKLEELMARWEGLEEQRQQITAAVEREFNEDA
jgi:ATP-binding cassette subfamily F protein 3